MQTNPELEQVDRLSQPTIEPCLTVQVRVTDPDHDVDVSMLLWYLFGVVSLTGPKKLGTISPGLEGSLNEVVAVSESWSHGCRENANLHASRI